MQARKESFSKSWFKSPFNEVFEVKAEQQTETA